MTQEELQKRIASHKAQVQNLISQVQAYQGAIQEAEYWLSILSPKTFECSSHDLGVKQTESEVSAEPLTKSSSVEED